MLLLKRKFFVLLSLPLLVFPPAAEAAKHRPAPIPIPDPVVSRNWGLDNQEQASHINAKKAWKIAKPKHEVVVAVIDTGIDPKHPIIKKHLWKDPKTKGGYGYDFILNHKNPLDPHGHGTHVAGIILEASGSSAGKSKVKIMPIRYYATSGTNAEHLDFTVKAIEYAVDHGAKVINFSAEGVGFNRAEYQAIRRAESKGVLFVTAAGNQAQDNDASDSPCYPASYDLSNIITVAATNIHNNLVPSSNWGQKHVHVAAPGEMIFSSLPNGGYGYNTGTSQATAFVSGLAALLLSENPKLTPQELKSIIQKSADPIPALQKKVASGGRINAYAALMMERDLSRGKRQVVAENEARPKRIIQSEARAAKEPPPAAVPASAPTASSAFSFFGF